MSGSVQLGLVVCFCVVALASFYFGRARGRFQAQTKTLSETPPFFQAAVAVCWWLSDHSDEYPGLPKGLKDHLMALREELKRAGARV